MVYTFMPGSTVAKVGEAALRRNQKKVLKEPKLWSISLFHILVDKGFRGIDVLLLFFLKTA